MEDLLEQIVKESSGSGSSSGSAKHAQLKTVCKEVHDFLEAQQGSVRASPHELRGRCLAALKLTLESKSSKLVSLAVVGFQKFLRDDRFHSKLECESESEWLPTQLLSAVSSLCTQPDDVQLNLLKVLLNMAACTMVSMNVSPWSLNEPVVVLRVLDVCRSAYSRTASSPAVKTAAVATAGHTLRAFCEHLANEEAAIRTNPYCINLRADGDEDNGVHDSAFDKVVIVLKHICEKPFQKPLSNNPKERIVQFNLECVLALMASLPSSASISVTLRNHLWQELCPTLLSLLGTPTAATTIGVVADGHLASLVQPTLTKSPSLLTTAEIKTVYGICVELVRLVGLIGGLRPMLESMFHRILLSTSMSQRLDALRATKEIMRKDELLLRFAGPPMVILDKRESCFTDLGLLKLAMDAFVECSDCPDSRVRTASVECVVALLHTLLRICDGHGMDTVLASRINDLYSDLESADYKGPMTYQTWEKFQKCVRPKQEKQELEWEKKNEEEVDGPVNLDDGLNNGEDEAPENCSSNVKDTDDESETADGVEGGLPLHGEAIGGIESSRDVDPPSGYETDSSVSTEGPEEDYEDSDDDEESVMVGGRNDAGEAEARGSQNEDRRRKVPRTLLGEEDGRAEQERMARLYDARDMYSTMERRNARHFVDTLCDVLPALLRIKSSIEADELMQEFASKYCSVAASGQLSSDHGGGHRMIINADGIYLAMYASLLLNLKSILNGYYMEPSGDPPMTEEEFVDNVYGGGVLVYLSADWLAELYQSILKDNILGNAGYDRSSNSNSALINLLTDLEGTNGAHLLSDYYRLEKTVINENDGLDVKAGRKFARRLLTGFWDDILRVLWAHLKDKHGTGLLSGNIGMLFSGGADGKSKSDKKGSGEAISASLDGLQKAARLSSILDLHSRCESVFSMLSAVSCPSTARPQTPTRRRRLKASVMALGKRRNIKLHMSHALSMDVMLSRGLELGSHCSPCWKHVFRCCFYLAELEHLFFSHKIVDATETPSLDARRSNRVTPRSSRKQSHLEFDDTEIPMPSVQFPGNAPQLSVSELIDQDETIMGANGVLTEAQSVRVLCSLSQQVDRLFDDAAYKLNLKSLLSFLTEMSSESRTALFSITTGTSAQSSEKRSSLDCGGPMAVRSPHDYHGNTLLLYRLGDVMLKCVRSGRPLVHVMQAWSIVGLHLMEAACHVEQDIAKRAVTCIHGIVSALLGTQAELPHFHFNEALFKPFENLLCLELCDVDIQDQIICSICEFVEGSKAEIRSGWRPLFGALRSVRLHRPALPPHLPSSPTAVTHPTLASDPFLGQNSGGSNATVHLISRHVVFDVFDAFLNTESNVLVFANAAVDCILCLLKHIQGSPDDDSLGDDRRAVRQTTPATISDLCVPSLKYIHTCCQTLASMHLMPNCPLFHASNRIQLGSQKQYVDPVIPGFNLVTYGKDDDNDEGGDEGSSDNNNSNEKPSVDAVHSIFATGLTSTTLDELECSSGILHVWCLILEGLVAATANCPRRNQPDAVHTLFTILTKIYELPGVEFGLYVGNHILLPMMQSWLRRASKLPPRSLDGFATNYKQCCGQTTDLVVDYLTKLAGSGQLSSARGGSFLLHQLFLLMTECVAQSNESISRLGCSCIRHVILTTGPLMTPELWTVTVTALKRISDVSLFYVKQLMAAFKRDSDNFYGDLCQIKVAAKSDCSPQENERLQQLAQQVFLLDNQRLMPNGVLLDDPIDDDKSYMFLLYSTSSERDNISESVIVKVPFRSLVVQLVSHQLLLQTVGLLLSSTSHVVPSLANILLQNPTATTSGYHQSRIEVGSSDAAGAATQELPPGMMRYLSGEQVCVLLECLKDSYNVSCEFDARPGLKFLVQKVARASAAANLYKQSGASWTLRAVTLLELCLYRMKTTTTNSKTSFLSSTFLDTCCDELRVMFDEVCGAYADHFAAVQKGEEDRFASLQDQAIFFLVAHDVEDYMEARRRGGEESKTDERPAFGPSPQEERGSELCVDATTTAPSEIGRDALDECEDSDVERNEEDDGDDDDDDGSEFEGKTHVYEVASKKDINSMVSEFKKRKRQCSMPPPSSSCSAGAAFGKGGVRRKSSLGDYSGSTRRRSDREETKLPSVLKDHQACMKVRTEMLVSMFDFFCQVDDTEFSALLPVTFPFARTLVAHGIDPTLRQTLAEFLDRIARIYGFGTEPVASRGPPPESDPRPE